MKTYTIQIAVAGDSGLVWSNRGQIKGRSVNAMLKRAWCNLFNSPFEFQPVDGTIIYDRKSRTVPVLRLVEA